jgi:hypothetical protein
MFAPWMIEREHLDLPAVPRAVRLVHTGRRAPSWVSSDAQTSMFTDSSEVKHYVTALCRAMAIGLNRCAVLGGASSRESSVAPA